MSILDPHGPKAALIRQAWWVMFAGATVILLLVLVLLLYAALRDPQHRRQLRGTGLTVAGGLVLPVVALSGLLVYGTYLGEALRVTDTGPALRIEVIGQRWRWEARYPDVDPAVVTANEIHIPAGTDVEFVLATRDVIHSFWVPNLGGKLDLIPGHVNRLRLRADRPGTYLGHCAEFCGALHALMGLMVVAHPPARFQEWLARQRQLAASAERCRPADGAWPPGAPPVGPARPEISCPRTRIAIRAPKG